MIIENASVSMLQDRVNSGLIMVTWIPLEVRNTKKEAAHVSIQSGTQESTDVIEKRGTGKDLRRNESLALAVFSPAR